ncbi:MAG: DUF2953 domain-containing protein [Syntrophomonas sp.]|nr:DUF2953 domain-containing protein [Syntrophomonas sp.]
MTFWVLAICILLMALVLSLYVKAEIILKVREDEIFQGISLQVNSRLYKADRNYDYTDSNLRLLESILISAVWQNKTNKNKPSASPDLLEVLWQASKGFPIRSLFELCRGNSDLIIMTLRYIVVEKLDWISTVGSKDALHTALGTGMCWTLKGIIIGILSSRCSLAGLRLDVKADFDNPSFLSSFTCILKMRLVHIIIIEIYAIIIKVRWCLNGFSARTEPSH